METINHNLVFFMNGLVNRLRHNVIKAGVRMINLSYSRISLTDIAQKLQLDSPEDAEFIVAKVLVICLIFFLKVFVTLCHKAVLVLFMLVTFCILVYFEISTHINWHPETATGMLALLGHVSMLELMWLLRVPTKKGVKISAWHQHICNHGKKGMKLL